MKRVLYSIIGILVVVFLMSGCKYSYDASEKKINENIDIKDNSEDKSVDDNKDSDSSKKYINPYFPYEDNQEVIFAGRMLEHDVFEGNITLKFRKIMSAENGELWKVDIVKIEDDSSSKTELKEFLYFRDSLYYFFVTKSKIYWIEQENFSKKEKELICKDYKNFENKRVVCQDKKKEMNEDGYHCMITIEDNDYISYSSWFKLQSEASYLRSFTFKHGDGFVVFSSQDTPAGRHSIEIWDDKIYFSKGYSEIEKLVN